VTKHKDRIEKIEKVRLYLADHLGSTAKDVAYDMGFKYSTACDYVEAIRQEWRGKSVRKTKEN
jgi:hypothetical protein